MATIWFQASDSAFEPVGLADLAERPVDGADVRSDERLPGVRIVTFNKGSRPAQALLASSSLVETRVNGLPIVGGIKVLGHKDELVAGSRRAFFSCECTPFSETYRLDGSRRRSRCPVCRAEIQDGQTVVRCPGCERVYHQVPAMGETPEKPCWTYAPACRFCDHPTSMSGEPHWHPHEEQHHETS